MITSRFRSLVGGHGLAAFVLAVGLTAAPAAAGIPALNLMGEVDGNLLFDGDPGGGSDNGEGVFRWSGSIFDSGLQLEYSITGKPDPLLSLGITLVNTTLNDIDVTVAALLPIAPQILEPTQQLGSAAFGFTAPDGGGFASSIGPAWIAQVDGVTIAELLDPLDLQSAGLGSDAADDAFSGAGPAQVLNDIGITTTFTLSPGSLISLTSGFSVFVPGPAGIATLGALLLLRRRRR